MPNKSLFSGRITLEEAAEYLEKLGENESLEPIFSNHLGGTLDAQIFKDWYKSGDFKGVIAWFCTKGLLGANPFLVFEKAGNTFSYPKTLADCEKLEPMSEDLVYSNHRFSRNLKAPNRIEYLRIHKSNPPHSNLFEKNDRVKGFVKKYLGKEKIKKYQKIGFGYLENGYDGQDFFGSLLFPQGKNVRFIRYYFGFDPTLPLNLIRFILVPVDENGLNITSYLKNGKEEQLILQKSWPPPPIL